MIIRIAYVEPDKPLMSLITVQNQNSQMTIQWHFVITMSQNIGRVAPSGYNLYYKLPVCQKEYFDH